MNENSQPPFGKISVHGNGVGAPTPESVEKRAREIALIDERNPNKFTKADWEQARRELSGVDEVASAEDTNEIMDNLSDRDSVPDENGHRVPRAGLEEDDETLGAHLVAGGLEEAAHDQMVEAARDDQEQEG
ncbi:MAG TPA: hypothetical protein VK474_13725 [Chthoniobacterales bacterium]|nr:hypothetical protein [Chthoniobacterales bacterium]